MARPEGHDPNRRAEDSREGGDSYEDGGNAFAIVIAIVLAVVVVTVTAVLIVLGRHALPG
jgi:hypothetical protein